MPQAYVGPQEKEGVREARDRRAQVGLDSVAPSLGEIDASSAHDRKRWFRLRRLDPRRVDDDVDGALPAVLRHDGVRPDLGDAVGYELDVVSLKGLVVVV